MPAQSAMDTIMPITTAPSPCEPVMPLKKGLVSMEPVKGLPPRVVKDADMASKFECGHCQHLLTDPCQLECGHRYCRLCIEDMVRDKEEEKCHLCLSENPEEVQMFTRESYQKDYACRRAMSKLAVRCLYYEEGCTFEDTLKHLEEHLLSCEYARITCQCGLKLPKKKLKEHELDCDLALQGTGRCRFGCSDEELTDGDDSLEKHNRENLCQHVSRLYDCTWQTKHRLTQRIEQLADKLTHVETQRQLKSTTTDVPPVNQSSGQYPVSTSGSTFIEESRKNMKVMEEKVKVTHNLFSVLFKEAKQASERLLTLERHIQQVTSERERQQQELRMALDGVQSSINGVLLWEIEDVKRRCEEARSAGHASILSPPFYTSRAGYKLCGRIYLNGDGVGQGQYLSLFIVMMKGKYDALLAWPFNQFVTFTLIDQSGQGRHVRDSFRTDPASTSFRRPRTDMNIASGCPRFMGLQDLNSQWKRYVQEDTMMIELRVDTQGLENYGGQSA